MYKNCDLALLTKKLPYNSYIQEEKRFQRQDDRKRKKRQVIDKRMLSLRYGNGNGIV